jgi:hypothetical protein
MVLGAMPIETRVIRLLQEQPEALSAEQVASTLSIDLEQAEGLLMRLFANSKVEMKPGVTPVYRLVEKTYGREQLSISLSVVESPATPSRGWGYSGSICGHRIPGVPPVQVSVS